MPHQKYKPRNRSPRDIRSRWKVLPTHREALLLTHGVHLSLLHGRCVRIPRLLLHPGDGPCLRLLAPLLPRLDVTGMFPLHLSST